MQLLLIKKLQFISCQNSISIQIYALEPISDIFKSAHTMMVKKLESEVNHNVKYPLFKNSMLSVEDINIKEQ